MVETDTQLEVNKHVKSTNIIPTPSLRRSDRVCFPPEFYRFHIENKGELLISDHTLANMEEPSSYKEAMLGTEAAKWKDIIESKIQSMYGNQVWNLVYPTPNIKPLGANGS